MDQVFIGVDTHKANHIAVAINTQGARLGTISIAANQDGYRGLDAWAAGLGRVIAFGIETGSYGAGLSRDLQARGHTVLDVMRPNRQLRYPSWQIRQSRRRKCCKVRPERAGHCDRQEPKRHFRDDPPHQGRQG